MSSNPSSDRRVARLRQMGRCYKCGGLITDTRFKMCETCRETARLRVVEKKKTGCSKCGKPSDGKWMCKECAEEIENCRRKRTSRYLSQGLCYRCGRPTEDSAVGQQRMCEVCYLKRKALEHTGSSKNWKMLQEILDKQERRCPYTGESLLLGVNTSLDHIVPKSRKGASERANLQWVDVTVNTMKTNLTHSEFVAKLRGILAHIEKDL
jgi:hypothetical protein